MGEQRSGFPILTRIPVPFISGEPQPTADLIQAAIPEGMSLVELDGRIGVVCNGAGLVMTTLDLIARAEGKSAFALNIGGDTLLGTLPLAERLRLGLETVQQRQDMRVILLNLLYGAVEQEGVGEAIAPFLKRRDGLRCAIVLRWSGIGEEVADFPCHPQLHIFEQLDAAIAKAVALAYPSVAQQIG